MGSDKLRLVGLLLFIDSFGIGWRLCLNVRSHHLVVGHDEPLYV